MERAQRLGCDAMQIFGRNPRSWIYTPLPEAEARLFRHKRKEAGLFPVVVHTNYLINLTAPDDGIFHKSIDMFKKELGIAEALGADYLVTHLGSPQEMGPAFALKRVSLALLEVARSGLGRTTRVLLENTSGSGTGFGSKLDDIGRIIRGAKESGLDTGLCFDTCHAFAAGYSFSTPQEADSLVKSALLDDIKTGEKKSIDVEGVFIFVGINPTTDFADVDKDDMGFIKTDARLQTSMPGVFAAGDCRTTPLLQVATAVGDGAIAAASAIDYIEQFETEARA